MKIFVSLSFVIILVLFSGGVGFAAPTINSVSGSLYHGNSVIISGIAFGSKTPAAPLIWDDFEWGSDSDNIEDGDWTNYHDDNPVEIDTDQKYGQGTRSSYNACSKEYLGDDHNQFGMAYQYFTESDEIYLTYRWRWSKEPGATGKMFTKLARVTAPGGVYSPAPNFNDSYWYGLQYSMHYHDGIETNKEYIGYKSILPPDNWNKIENYWKGSDAGVANGTYQVWNNLTLIWDNQSVITRRNGITDGLNSVFTPHNAVNPTVLGEDWYFWVDDFYLDNTSARIEIGDNSVWANCTHREIQIPSAWLDTSITITANQGSFADGENVYVFVVDADGNVSNSYGPITIGSGEKGDDTTPPGDVTDLTKQVGDGQVVLEWTNPTDSDFKGTMIRYRTDGTYPANNSDGIEVCNKTTPPGASDTYTITGLLNGTTYYFSAFTYDQDGNYSKAAHISATPYANVYTKIFGDISGADFPQTCKDTYLNAGEAGVNYSSNSEFLNTYTWPINTAANRIVMKWDLSALPQDTIIQEATLSLYMHTYSGDGNYEITAHKIITHNPDISSCTWNTYNGSNSWTGGANGGEQDIASAESSTIVDKTSGYKNWNITQMVQEWVDNSSTNFGLMLNSDTTAASDSNRYFRPTEYLSQDQRPVLTIKYCGSDISKVPSEPTGLTVIGE
ncbi:MAG: DNRLRE domain-containing protein [Thermodesulfobacteriota bacterium]|nr:DNRLRE domain-containing protein [Thermodesulfobacteriota bacterium]